MSHFEPLASTRRLLTAAALLGGVLSAGCTAKVGNDDQPNGSGATGSGATGAGGTGTGGTSTGGTTTGGTSTGGTSTGGTGTGGTGTGGTSLGGTGNTTCVGTEVVTQKRLVRLTFNQLVNNVRMLFDDALATTIGTTWEVGDPLTRTFPPLLNPREGTSITDMSWLKGDNIAQDVAEHVFTNFATITSCGMAPTAQCGHDYLLAFAARAYRHPLTPAETTRLETLYTSLQVARPTGPGATIQQAVQHGVYAVLDSPQFLYRTEFGDGATVQGGLKGYEVADQLAFFLTDGPPDPALLDAASQGMLSTIEQVTAQATRLLGTPAAHENLEAAMFAYFGVPSLDTVIIDPLVATGWDEGLRSSMYTEVDKFLQNALWAGPLTEILNGRKTSVNERLAELYGIPTPMGATTTNFVTIDMPATRSGILTLPAMLTLRSSPDRQSVVRRGLLVNAAFLCAENPEFPADDMALQDEIAAVTMAQADATQRERAAYRAMTPRCTGCHSLFDAYGLALENYDLIGKYRTTELTPVSKTSKPIDASATLPDNAGGVTIMNAVELASALAGTNAFSSCMAVNLIGFALAEGAAVKPDSCATQGIITRFNATSGKTFTDLVREVAVSNTLAARLAGGAP